MFPGLKTFYDVIIEMETAKNADRVHRLYFDGHIITHLRRVDHSQLRIGMIIADPLTNVVNLYSVIKINKKSIIVAPCFENGKIYLPKQRIRFTGSPVWFGTRFEDITERYANITEVPDEFDD